MSKKSKNKIEPAESQLDFDNKIGVMSEIRGYLAKTIINKNEVPDPIYPLNTPMPIYTKDEQGFYLLIYEQNLIAPTSNLPSLTIVNDEGVVKLDPAKNFILQSSLSEFLGYGIFVSENAVSQLLSDIYLINTSELIKLWKTHGFNHLRLVLAELGGEKFKVFMRVFSEMMKKVIMEQEEIRSSLLTTLVEIGKKNNFNNDKDFLMILKEFMDPKSAALVLESKKSNISCLLVEEKLKYGDLLCFNLDNKKTLCTISEVNLTAQIEPIFIIEDNKPSISVRPLLMGQEGYIDGVEEIVNRLYDFSKNYIKIPIGKIQNHNQDYSIILKSNELIHFVLIAISGSGKGNTLKELIFENLKIQIDFEKKNGNLNDLTKLGIILFDDVGEYVKSLKPQDWGLNIGAFTLKFSTDIEPRIQFADIGSRVELDPSYPSGYEFMQVKPMKIPIEYISMSEILMGFSSESVAITVIPQYIRSFYNEHPYFRPSGFDETRLSIEFINYFMDRPFDFSSAKLDLFGFQKSSFEVARRNLRNFLNTNKTYLGLKFNWEDEHFDYIKEIRKEVQVLYDDKGNEATHQIIQIKDDYNLVKIAESCAEKGKIIIIDESSLNPSVKLLTQRIILNHLINTRESRGYNKDITPCLFIIEEATALMRGKESKRLQLFAEVSVKARKFGIGIGLVLQDIAGFEPSLLNQLGWLIAMGLPVDSMRNLLFRNVPADLGPYDDFVKNADIGIAVGFQKLIGKNLPLPIQINHYEGKVKEYLWNLKTWGDKTGFDEDTQRTFQQTAKDCNIPEDVVENILKKEDII